MLFARNPSSSELVLGNRAGGGRRAWKSPIIAAALFLVAAGCSGDDEVSPEAAATTAAPITTSTAPIQVPLPTDVIETYLIPGFGYSIDYPSGWFAETREPNTQLAQIDEDLFSDSIEDLHKS